MTAIDRSLLTEILDGVTAVHKYLTEDLVNEHLSANANLRRQALSETLGTISQKIQTTHPSIRPRVNAPGSLLQTHPTQKPPLGQKPPTTAHKPPPIGQKPPIAGPKPIPGQKPPLASKPLPPPEEEEQEMYEVPVIDDLPREPEAETYLDFEPSATTHDADEPQEEYTDMQTEEGRIEEEMYEDPSQVQQEDSTVSSQVPIEEEQEVYDEPSLAITGSDPPVRVTLSPPPSQPPPPVPAPSNDSEAGYMDPQITRNTGLEGSLPENVSIEDWASAYDTSFKKGEKVRPSELKDVIKRGWIEKLGGRSQKSWQKRFCAISSVFMYFYEKDYSRSYNNRVVVPGYVVNQAPDLTNAKKKQFVFKLTATDGSGLGKDYYFRTNTEQDREEWIGALRATYKIGQIGRSANVEEAAKRLSVTLPRTPRVSPPVEPVPRPSSVVEQEDYEAIVPVMNEENQEDYVDVTEQVGEKDGEEQEEYVDLQRAHQIPEEEEEDQDEYTVPPEIPYTFQPQSPPQMARPQPQPRPPSSVISPPPPQPQPRPPSSTMSPPPTPIQRMPLPQPPPTAVSPAAPPSQPQPVKQAPSTSTDVHVDTSIIYTQQTNGILYNKVYVALWDFAGYETDELPLKRGNLVLVDDPTPGRDWWFGELLDSTASKKEGATGLFPSTYTTVAFECVS